MFYFTLDDDVMAVKFRYDGKYLAFQITGDGSDLRKELDRATWENELRYYVTLDSKNVGTYRVHGGKIAIYTESGCVVLTKLPEDYSHQLWELGYREVFGDCPVPGSGCNECIQIYGYCLH